MLCTKVFLELRFILSSQQSLRQSGNKEMMLLLVTGGSTSILPNWITNNAPNDLLHKQELAEVSRF
ncbi:hypothetical protein P3S67_026611 [Capsicum chacoense]